jgi:hypothetical protein
VEQLSVHDVLQSWQRLREHEPVPPFPELVRGEGDHIGDQETRFACCFPDYQPLVLRRTQRAVY